MAVLMSQDCAKTEGIEQYSVDVTSMIISDKDLGDTAQPVLP